MNRILTMPDVTVKLNNTGGDDDDEDNWNGISGSGEGPNSEDNPTTLTTLTSTLGEGNRAERTEEGDDNFHIIAVTASIAAVLIIMLIVLIIICVRRRRKQKKTRKQQQQQSQNVEMATRSVNNRQPGTGAGSNDRLYSESSYGPPLTTAPPPPYPGATTTKAAAAAAKPDKYKDPHAPTSSPNHYYDPIPQPDLAAEPNHYEEIPCSSDNTGKGQSSSASGSEKDTAKTLSCQSNRKGDSDLKSDPESKMALLSKSENQEKGKGP